MQGVRINRNVKVVTYPFTEIFQGFENTPAARGIFSNDTEKVLAHLKVELFSRAGYMGVSDTTGNLLISLPYLKSGDEQSIYLDVVHELVHVKQFMKGKDLFDLRYSYVDRPTEVEAYAYTVKEARRIGMSDEAIFDYLKTEWMTKAHHRRLAKRLGLKLTERPKGKRARLVTRI